MQVSFTDERLAVSCSDSRKRKSIHGINRGKKIGIRLDDLKAAESLQDMRSLPGKCHELKGDRSGTLALPLDGLYRLIIEPDHDPLPMKEDGGLDWHQVTRVTVIRIEDYHG